MNFFVCLFTLQISSSLLDVGFFLAGEEVNHIHRFAHFSCLNLSVSLALFSPLKIGLLCIGLEYKTLVVPNFMMHFVEVEMHLVLVPFYRSVLYVIFGAVLLLEYTDFLYFWIGFMYIMVGIILGYFAKR